MRDVKGLEKIFQNLKHTIWNKTSEIDPKYNCIAYAADVLNKWYWPDNTPLAVWPPNIPKVETLDAFKALYQSIGYTDCADGSCRAGFDKVAIYANAAGNITHAAVFKSSDGVWKSKLGVSWDIEHEINGLDGPYYGSPIAFLERASQ